MLGPNNGLDVRGSPHGRLPAAWEPRSVNALTVVPDVLVCKSEAQSIWVVD